jgi:hypothetical protein
MQKILDSIPKERIGSMVSSSDIAKSLVETYKLVDLMLLDLTEYEERVNAEWEKGTINKDNVDSIEPFNLPFSHRSNIASRLAFIR